MVQNLPCNRPRRPGVISRYPLWMARRILRQALLVLDLLHSNGIAHGDFQPGNLLFSLRDLDAVPEGQLRQGLDRGSISKPVRRRDGKQDRWAPNYLATTQSLEEFVDIGPELNIKLSDFGEVYTNCNFWTKVFYVSEAKQKPNTPLALRAPELLLDLPFDEKTDIWSFGCVAFELIVGIGLFGPEGFPTEQQEDDELLLQMTGALGDLPDSMFSKWPRADKYFGPDRERINRNVVGSSEMGSRTPSDYFSDEPLSNYEGEEEESDWDMSGTGSDAEDDGGLAKKGDADPLPPHRAHDQEGHSGTDLEDPPSEHIDDHEDQPPAPLTMEERFRNFGSKDMSDTDATQILSLMRTILQYEPRQRPSAAQLLENPFFSEETDT